MFEILERRNANAKITTKHDLEQLIKMRADKTEFTSKLEKNLDQNMVEQIVQAFHEDQRERKAIDNQRKSDLKSAWIEQAIVNQKIRTVDNLFN